MERKPACSSGANSDARGGERAGRTEYMEKDLTSGSVLKNIFTFSLPYLFSYFLQTLYGMADLFIIGIEIAVMFPDPSSSAPLWLACVTNGISVGIGELISCTVLGVLLVRIIEASPAVRKVFES